MQLLELTLSMTLVFGGGAPASATFDIYPAVVVPVDVNVPFGFRTILALPHVVLYDSDLPDFIIEEELPHELKHIHHWEALGPGFTLAYAASLGRPFEDYLNDGWMWEPTPAMRNCPLLRFTAEGNDEGALLMPCFQVWR